MNMLIGKYLYKNQNVFITVYELHNMFINLLKNDYYLNNSIIGKLYYDNNCNNYKISGGCFCYLK